MPEPLKILSTEQVPIPDRDPINWTGAAQVIVRVLTVEKNGSRFHFRYKDLGRPVSATSTGFTIETFAKSLLAAPYVPNGEDYEENHYLDICVRRASYVVIMLDRDLNWRFNDEHVGVTLGDTNLLNFYGKLRHVVLDDTQPPSPTPLKGCKLVYFSALHRTGSEAAPAKTPINLNIDIVQTTGAPTKIVIDPDIRNPGNGDPP